MRAMRQIACSEPVKYAERLANDASLRADLRRAVSDATVLARKLKGRSGAEAVKVFADSDVQRSALTLVRSLERALERAEPGRTHHRRNALVGLFAGLCLAAAVGVSAKASAAGR